MQKFDSCDDRVYVCLAPFLHVRDRFRAGVRVQLGSNTSLFPFRITVASERPIIALYSIAHF